MDIQEISKRSDTIDGNPLPNTFILCAMMGEYKTYEEPIERIALQLFQAKDNTQKEMSDVLFSNIFDGIPGMMAVDPQNGIQILKRVFQYLNLLSHQDYISWSEKNNGSIIATSRTILTITLAWFNKITEGTQDEFYNFMSEVMTNNQNLSLEDHSLLNEANQKVNEMLWN